MDKYITENVCKLIAIFIIIKLPLRIHKLTAVRVKDAIAELLRTIDGPIAPLPCLSRRAYQRCEDCTDEATCRIRKVFAEVFSSYLAMIEPLTLLDMLQSDPMAKALDNLALAKPTA